VITSVSLTSIDIGGGKGNPGGQTATLPASINYIAPANSLVNGELATFTGTLDQQGNCAAASLTVAPGLSLAARTDCQPVRSELLIRGLRLRLPEASVPSRSA